VKPIVTREEIEEAFNKALDELVAERKIATKPQIVLEEPKDESHGHLACNIAMRLAKSEKKKPREVAQLILNKLAEFGISAGASVEPQPQLPQEGQVYATDVVTTEARVAGPGFINLTQPNAAFHRALQKALAAGQDYGRSEVGKGKRANVEFVSANPTGPLTVGHGRQAILGDAICRVLEFCGFDVEREYYYNDAGRQMRVLGESLRLRYLEALADSGESGEKAEFPDDFYRGEYLAKLARELVDDHGDALRDNEWETFKSLAEKRVFTIIEATLTRLGITFDRFFNEYDLYKSDEVAKVVQRFRTRGDAYDKDDAVWFRAKKYGCTDDRVIIKSTGEPTYRLPDIAYHLDKLGRGYDRIIDVFGQDHHSTAQDVQAGLKAILSYTHRAHELERITVLLHQFVTLTRGGEQVKMSTRRAEYVTLDDLLDEISAQIGEELREKEDADSSPRVVGPITPERLDTMARDAVRYFYSMRRMESHLEFDLKLAVSQSMQNPVYYLQYAHARICSIFKKWRERGGDTSTDFRSLPEAVIARLVEPEELRISKLVARFPKLVEQIADSYETHRISEYLHTLARELQGYYEKHRVLGDDEELMLARLALIHAVRTVLANGLGKLLGISAPESM